MVGGVLRGHLEAHNPLLAECIDQDGGRHRGVNTTGEHHASPLVVQMILCEIVPNAEFERTVGIGSLVLIRHFDGLAEGFGVHNSHLLLEGVEQGHSLAFGVEHSRRAVVDNLSRAADVVHKNHIGVCHIGLLGEFVVALLDAAELIAVGAHNDDGARIRKVVVTQCISTQSHSHLLVADVHILITPARNHIGSVQIARKALLGYVATDVAVFDVGCSAHRATLLLQGQTDEHGDIVRKGGNLHERLLGLVEEETPHQKRVCRGAGDGLFGEHHEVGTVLLGLCYCVDNVVLVVLEITTRVVDLCNRDFHSLFINK